MASSSVNGGNQLLPTDGSDEELKKLRIANFDLRSANQKLQTENSVIKRTFSEQKQELQDTKTKLETEIKKHSAVVAAQPQRKENARQQSTSIQQRREVHKNVKTSKNEKKNISAKTSTSEEEDRVRRDLEEDINRKKRKLKEKSVEIEKLNKELKCEREKCSENNKELTDVKRKLEETTSQLEDANKKLSRNKNLRTIKVLKSQLKNMKENHASQNSSIEEQKKCISKLEHQVKLLEDSLKSFEKSCEEKDALLSDKDVKLKKAKSLLVGKAEFIRLLEVEREYVLWFIQKVKVSSEFPEKEDLPLLNQLEELSAHVENNMAAAKQAKLSASNHKAPATFQNLSIPAPPPSPPPSPSLRSDLPASEKEHSSFQPSTGQSFGQDPLFNDIVFNIKSSINVLPRQAPLTPASKQTAHNGNVNVLQKIAKKKIAKKNLQGTSSMAEQPKNFKCQVCPRRFSHFGHMKRHLQEVHDLPLALNKYLYGCSTCGGYFESRQLQKVHTCLQKTFGFEADTTYDEPMEIENTGPEVPMVTTPEQVPNEHTTSSPGAVPSFEEDTDEVDDIEIIDLTDDRNLLPPKGKNCDEGVPSEPTRLTAMEPASRILMWGEDNISMENGVDLSRNK